jgi:hypothetical protein
MKYCAAIAITDIAVVASLATIDANPALTRRSKF